MNAALQALSGSGAWVRFLGAASGVGGPTLARLGAPTLAALAEFGTAVGVVAVEAGAREKNGVAGLSAAPASTTAPPPTLLGGHPVDARAILPSLETLKAVGVGGGGGGPPPPAKHLPPLSAARDAGGKGAARSRAACVRAVPLPRQEDAQEYLTHLLDAADCELAALAGRAGGGGQAGAPGGQQQQGQEDEGEEGGWVTAGRTRRAAAVTRGSGLGGASPSASASSPAARPLTAVRACFGGLLRSEVRTGGLAPPSATLQPFTLLSLDAGAPGVACIPSALDALTRPEPIEGYRVGGAGAGGGGGSASAPVRATKALTLSPPLPPTLILHLNRFTYDGAAGGGKLGVPIAVPATLRLKAAWLAGGGGGGGGARPYTLAGVVAHHGPGLGSGHYTAFVAQPDGRWLVFDDADVRPARGAPWSGGAEGSTGFGGGGGGGDAYLVVYERK